MGRRVVQLVVVGLVGWGVVAGLGAAVDRGTGSSEPKVPEGPLTSEEYVVHADRACAREALAHSSGGLGTALSGDMAELSAEVWEMTHATVSAQAAALRALPVPAGDEEEVAVMIDSFDPIAAQLADIVADGDRGADPAVGEGLEGLYAEQRALLHAYGITACG